MGSFGLHARAGVDEQRQRDRQIRVVEERHLLLDAVLEDIEVLGREIGHVPGRSVGHRHVERDEIDAGAKRRLAAADGRDRRLRGRLRLSGQRRDQRGPQHEEAKMSHRRPCRILSLTSVPRAVIPAAFALTVTRSGGMRGIGVCVGHKVLMRQHRGQLFQLAGQGHGCEQLVADAAGAARALIEHDVAAARFFAESGVRCPDYQGVERCPAPRSGPSTWS